MENVRQRITLRIPAKASMWYVASSAIARMIGALGTPIFTRLLTADEYGLYPLYNTWLGVLSVLITLEIGGAIMYRGLQRYGDRADEFVSAALGIILMIFSGFCILYFAFHRLFNIITTLTPPTTLLMLTQILASATLSLYTAKARFEYRYKAVALLNILTAIATPSVAVLLIQVLGIRAESRVISSALTLSTIALPILLSTVKKSKMLYSREIWSYLLRKSLPLLPHYFAMTMILKAGEIALSRIHGAESLGKFSVALSLGMSVTVVSSGVMSALSPWMLRRVRTKEIDRVRELLLLITKLICLACLGLCAIAPEAIALFASPAYRTALPAVYPLALSVIPTFLSGALMSGAVYFERSDISALPSIAAASLSTLLALTVLPRTDYTALGITTLAAYTLLAAINVIVFTRLAKQSPIDVKATALLFTATCGYAALLFALHASLPLRIILAIPLAPALYKIGKEALGKIRE